MHALEQMHLSTKSVIIFAGSGKAQEALVTAHCHPDIRGIHCIEVHEINTNSARIALQRYTTPPLVPITFETASILTWNPATLTNRFPADTTYHLYSICTDPDVYPVLFQWHWDIPLTTLSMWDRMWECIPPDSPHRPIRYHGTTIPTHLCTSNEKNQLITWGYHTPPLPPPPPPTGTAHQPPLPRSGEG